MGAGKILIIFGAILTLVSTFFLSLVTVDMPGAILWLEAGLNYGNGMNFFMHITYLFTDTGTVATQFGLPVYLIYIIIVLLIFFVISGVIQLIGIKSRAAAIIGSIMPLFIGIIIILGSFMTTLPAILAGFGSFQLDSALVAGIVPFDLPLGGISLGAYLLVAGGALAFIGGIIGTSDL